MKKMHESLPEQIKSYLQDVQSQLAKDLIFLKEKIETTQASLLNLASSDLAKQAHLQKMLRGMRKRISKQREEILNYERAEIQLQDQNPQTTIKILTELADSSFSVWDIVVDRDNFIIPVQGKPNPPERFHHLKELIGKIYSSQQDEFLD